MLFNDALFLAIVTQCEIITKHLLLLYESYSRYESSASSRHNIQCHLLTEYARPRPIYNRP